MWERTELNVIGHYVSVSMTQVKIWHADILVKFTSGQESWRKQHSEKVPEASQGESNGRVAPACWLLGKRRDWLMCSQGKALAQHYTLSRMFLGHHQRGPWSSAVCSGCRQVLQINECDALRCCSPVNFRIGHLTYEQFFCVGKGCCFSDSLVQPAGFHRSFLTAFKMFFLLVLF